MDRLLFNFALLLSVLTLPAWIALILIAISCFRFHFFYESIAWGLFLDLLYASDALRFYHFKIIYIFAALAIFFISEMLKPRMFSYR